MSVAGFASAQDLASPQVSTQQAAPAANSGGGGEITSTRGETDHSQVVGHLGLRYFGSESIAALGASAAGGMGTSPAISSQTLQTVGVRYWLNQNLGLDAGLSLGIASGSSSTQMIVGSGVTTTSNDTPSFFGFGFHVGLPIMLAEAKHLSIHLDPYLSLAYGHSGITTGSGASQVDQSSSALNFGIGGNAVAELQFGFIGLPQLGLMAQLGVGIQYHTVSFTTTPQNTPSTTASANGFGLATTLGPGYSLTDILSGSISAVWYFGYTPGTAR